MSEAREAVRKISRQPHHHPDLLEAGLGIRPATDLDKIAQQGRDDDCGQTVSGAPRAPVPFFAGFPVVSSSCLISIDFIRQKVRFSGLFRCFRYFPRTLQQSKYEKHCFWTRPPNQN